MASTACSDACLALHLHAKSFSVSRVFAAHVTVHPCLRVELRGPAANGSWVILFSSQLFGCLELNMDTDTAVDE